MKAQYLIKKAPVEWEKTVNRLSSVDRGTLRKELEAISERAGMLAAYLDERHGYGCGDQGHGKAVKSVNKTGRLIHCKAFGYNAFHELTT